MVFLHISDLHFGNVGYTIERAKSNIEDILDVLATANFDKPHAIFITGDLIYAKDGSSRQQSNLQMLEKFIDNIMQILEVKKDNIFIVPGNHDVKRGEKRLAKCEEIKNKYELEDGISNDAYKYLQKGFTDFQKLHLGICSREYNLRPHLDFRSTYNVLSLNTALVSCQDQEERSLIIDIYSVRKELEKSDGEKPIIAIGHHPIESMHERESKMLLSLFFDYNVQIYLCGHEHQMICSTYCNNSNGSSKLYQFRCGTLMSRHPDKSDTDMLVYVGTIDNKYIGHVLPIKWDRRFERWMPDTGISYYREKSLDGFIYINKNRDDINQEKLASFIDTFLPELKAYGATIISEKLDSLIQSKGNQDHIECEYIKAYLIRRGYIAEIKSGVYQIN